MMKNLLPSTDDEDLIDLGDEHPGLECDADPYAVPLEMDDPKTPDKVGIEFFQEYVVNKDVPYPMPMQPLTQVGSDDDLMWELQRSLQPVADDSTCSPKDWYTCIVPCYHV